jgi:hypothetical protein
LTRSFKAASLRPPAVTVNFPVSMPSPTASGRTLSDCSSPRRAISAARSSTLTPALMRRTFASDATSLSSAISLATASVIFGMSFDSVKGRRKPFSHLLSLHRAQRALSLSGCRLPPQTATISAYERAPQGGGSAGRPTPHPENRSREQISGLTAVAGQGTVRDRPARRLP